MLKASKLLFFLTAFGAACAVGTTGEEVGDDSATNLRTEAPGSAGDDQDMGVTPRDAGPVGGNECPLGACEVDEVRCEGVMVRLCETDDLNPGCGIWGAPMSCRQPGETCVAGQCAIPTGCVDNDGDGHGLMCVDGDDCDDANDAVHEGAPELCDGIDNNCDAVIDDGFQLGSACTVGTGACQATGTLVCGTDGGVVCSGAPLGQPEICDGVDNDCNSLIDDGVCAACNGDIFEPNDSPTDATPLQANAPQWGYVCPGDTDWFELETQTGVTYHIYVTFPEEVSDLLVEGWVDGVNVVTGDTAGRDYEVFVVNGDVNKTFEIEVVERDGVESFFRVALVTSPACSSDDGFTPNQSLETAAQLPPFWLTGAYMCSGGLSDWYATGDLTAGDAFYAAISGEAQGTDLDLHLWGDPDGDGVFERMESSATFDNFEEIDVPIPHDGRYYIEVADFDGYGGRYDIGWSFQ